MGLCLLASHVQRHSVGTRWRCRGEVARPWSAPRRKLSGVLRRITENVSIYDTDRLSHTLTYRAHSPSAPTSPHSGSDTKQMFTHTAATRADTPCLLPFCHPWLRAGASPPGFCHLFHCCGEAGKICRNWWNEPALLVWDLVKRLI